MRILSIVLLLLSMNAHSQGKASGKSEKIRANRLKLSEVLIIAKRVIKSVDKKIDSISNEKRITYRPKSIEFNFETASTNTSEVGFSILIFSIGKKWTKSITNTISYTYTYPIGKPESGINSKDLEQHLSKAILEAFENIESLNTSDAQDLNEFNVKVSFSIEKYTTPILKYEFEPFTINAGKNWSKKAVHTVTVTFSKFDPLELIKKSNEVRIMEKLDSIKEIIIKEKDSLKLIKS